MDQAPRPSNFFDAHARVREARIKFIQYAEFRYRQFLSDPEQKPHAAACIHLNNWAEYRDRFGFRGLEALNRQFEERVIPELDHRDICARFSDSALVLVLAANKGRRDINAWASHVLELLGARPLEIEKHAVRATFSLGLCWFDRRVHGAEEALFNAIHVAEIQSERNENRLQVFVPASAEDEQPGDEEQTFRLIKHSLETNQMRIVFQPLLSSDSDGVRYYQVWARLVSERGKEVRARGFLDVARRTGVLARLNRWTLRRALHFLATDRNAGNQIRLFVNASIDTFEPRTMHWLEQMLEDHPACRNCLIAEIDEFEFSNRGTESTDIARNLKRMGIHPGVAGIAAGSLSRAEACLPSVDFIRMAPGFSDELERKPAFANPFIDLLEAAREHGVRVVMSELNSEQQIIDFWKLGVDLVQGNYIEHPRELLHSALSE